ncbi:MAG TPA: acyltransferase family protein, partial [Rhizomicrobium sp.]|nr:acyltransferase family protein [Rhizomicrobium sp.]
MTAKPPGSGKIAALAGARAFPPLMVVMFHFSEGHHYSGWPVLDYLATRGYLWVEFFFVLSGFILTHAYWPRLKDLLRPSGYIGFLRARLIRLYPLHLFMLLLILALVLGLRALAAQGGYLSIFDIRYHQDVSIKGFWLSLFLVHAWNSMPSLTWNGASWFVSVEFALCLMFPPLLWLAEGQAWRGLALIAGGMAGLLALLFTS